MTIDALDDVPASPPVVGLRLVATHLDETRRYDLALSGSEAVLLDGGEETPFPTAQLWPVVRDLLPPIAPLRAAPRGATAPPRRLPEPGFADDCQGFVSLTTVVDDVVTTRAWLATDDELWSVTPLPDGTTDLRPEAPGAVADLLVWDVTAAMEHLVHRMEAAS